MHAPSSYPHTTSSYHYICVLALLARTRIYAEVQLYVRELLCCMRANLGSSGATQVVRYMYSYPYAI